MRAGMKGVVAAAALVVAAGVVTLAAAGPTATAARATTLAGAAPTGALAFTQFADRDLRSDGVTAIYVVRTDGSGLRRLPAPCTDCAEAPSWSPDGSKLAYNAFGPDSHRHLFVANRDGSGARAIVKWCDNPTWSTDGRKIACELSGPNPTIGVIDARGGRLKRVPHLPQGMNPDWSADGKQFAFDVVRLDRAAGMRGIFVADVDGTHAKRIHAENAHRPSWSPDGRTVLAVRTDWSGIYLIPTRGGPTRLIKKSASSASWSPDGTRIAYTSPANGLHVLNLRNGQDRTLASQPNVCRAGSCDDVDWGPASVR